MLKPLFLRPYQPFQRQFSEFLIPDSVIEKLEKLGIHSPSPVQKALLPLFHGHSSVILKDQTGSGKTLGLVLGALVKKNPKLLQQRDFENLAVEYQEFLKRRLGHKNYTETLFVVPSMELALQIYSWTLKLSDGDELRSLVQLAIPNTTVEEQKEKLLQNIPRIVIGTPNRLLDLYTAKALDFSRLQTVIVDEVDRIVEPLSRYTQKKIKINRKAHVPVGEMLLDAIFTERGDSTSKRMGIGAQKDVTRRKPLQMIVSSATVNNPLKFFLVKQKGWMKKSVILDINSTLPASINHKAYYIDKNQMLVPITQSDIDQVDTDVSPVTKGGPLLNYDSLSECIHSISHLNKFQKALVFVQTNDSLIPLRDNLKALGINVKLLAGAHDELESGLVGKCDIILARDFESRGLNVPGLDHVLLVGDFTPQSYIHTSGRTGRYGEQGTAISLLLDSFQRRRYLQTIKKLNIQLV